VPQPSEYRVNDHLELEDCNGAVFLMTVKFIAARTALVQYVKPASMLNPAL